MITAALAISVLALVVAAVALGIAVRTALPLYRDLAYDEADHCRPVEVDGEIIRVHGAEEMTDEDRGHFAEIVRAAKAAMERERDGDTDATPPMPDPGRKTFTG